MKALLVQESTLELFLRKYYLFRSTVSFSHNQTIFVFSKKENHSNMSICILAIESSCDETSASIIKDGKVLNNIVATQAIHEEFGGVVPELASREHQKNIIPIVETALKEAGVSKLELSAIAFTRGPGLLGALLVGVSFAKGLAMSLGIPMIEVNHMQAHILAHFIEEPKPKFPFICLTVSGGHTQLVLVKSHLEMEVIGETQDDAVGEAFDKTAKIMELPYPGGPLIDKYAKEGNPHAFEFPDVKTQGLNFSFSGIKTAFLYFLRDKLKSNPKFIDENLPDICASMQHTLIRILMQKLKRAMREHKISEVGIAGGVSANSQLRKTLHELGEEKRWQTYIPAFEYCTDNAGMIAIAAHYKFLASDFATQEVSPMPRMKI
ncbi:MAG: N6-L-threonylcarbamoyladenine synthase [Flammeovirgaceae bacterium]